MTETEEEFEEKEREIIEKAEIQIDEDYERKDLKERRGFNKEHFYGGSKKKKHTIPKKG
ncbi:MAG: hypothetical protein OEV42_16400 [Deltaproteobacteria bacterium]|nr:hypothetical protein [Deltaproteobacteria bacterium]